VGTVASIDEKQALADELGQARALVEGGESKAALKLLERVRREALAGDYASELESVLAAAAFIYRRTEGKQQSEAGRLAFSTEQNIRFVGRKRALAEGREWVDPFPRKAVDTAGVSGEQVPKTTVSSRRLLLGAVLAVIVSWTPLLIGGLSDSEGWETLWLITAYLAIGWGWPGALIGIAVSRWARQHDLRHSTVVAVVTGITVAGLLLFGQAALADSFGIQLGDTSGTDTTVTTPTGVATTAPERSLAAEAARANKRQVVTVECTTTRSISLCVVTLAGPACQLWVHKADGTNVPLGDPKEGKVGSLQGKTLRCQ
jgi:hypothetical protein